MKRSYYFLLILLPISLIIFLPGCKKEDTPTAPNQLPKIESLDAKPATVLINTETTFTCVATDGDGDNLTITWSSKRGVFANGVIGATVRWVAPSTAGTDTINVIVNDGKQTVKGKIEIIVGTISASPTLLAPVSNAAEVALSPTLTWIPINGATSYTLQVSTSSSFISFVYNQSGLNNANQQISGLSIATLYYWRVNATNIYGTSEWSYVSTFNTVMPPPRPTLVAPNSDEVSLSPTLTWNAINNVNYYALQISTNSSFTNLIYNQNNLTNTYQQISGLSIATRYYWRVNATNNYGTSEWSHYSAFNTVKPPSSPYLLEPTNSAKEISQSPTLKIIPVNNATSYTFQISLSSTFTTFVYNQNGIANSDLLINGLNNSTNYYWRVRASNNYGSSDWSNVWQFTTCPPSCPGVSSIEYAGKIYNTVQIGSQCWLKENLDIGTMIQGNQNQTNNGSIEKYCILNKLENCITYGGLYQWNEMMQYSTLQGSKGICPTGWHIPSKKEFELLTSTVNNDGNALMTYGQNLTTNNSGFSALLGGDIEGNDRYSYRGFYAFFWSSQIGNDNYPFMLLLTSNKTEIQLSGRSSTFGLSVRCIKD